MRKIESYFTNLPEETKTQLEQVFLSVDKLYPVIYLLAKNEHLTSEEKPDRYEDRLAVMKQVRLKLEAFLNKIGLDGENLFADVASEYFDDYVSYKEKEFDLSNEDFLLIIRNISSVNLA